ncbi:multicopper oxidase family protein [Kribbella antibiotica]|uniref:Multicopper oxidase family protein n=1 Tax=Kribbella antibiotica TaxID=190195 RepID=A0A4R4ZT19_9ACTN|nr:multicopper oxidase family protein [Kribbella antibiotica]
MRRRKLLQATVGGLLLGASSGCSASSGGGGNNETESSAGTLLRSTAKLPEPFTVPLPIPAVLRPSGTDRYDVTQRAAKVEILPGLTTEIWGYDGTFPGPTIESRRGRQIVVRHRNELAVPAVVHLHGGRTPADSDGYPTDVIKPGGSRDYTYPLDQAATTLWYHDHTMDYTGPQVYKGLAGFHLIRDDVEDALPLPRGKREIPLMITDRAFAEDGSFHYPMMMEGMPGVAGEYMSGVLGDCILVNGAPWPVLEVSATRYRFRILNASNARRYKLKLDPPTPIVQIGSDQGLLAAPVEHDDLPVAPAERFDVIIDFSRYAVGQQVTLTNRFGSGGTKNVMRFVVARSGSDDSRVPDRLAEIEPLSRSQAVVQRQFTFERNGPSHHGMTTWAVNGQAFSPDTIVAEPALGTVELWKLRAQNVPHPIHIHLAPFQVVDPGRTATGWKDTVDLASGDEAEVLLRFDGYRGKYVFHCHNLEHEDMMMMANFRVR